MPASFGSWGRFISSGAFNTLVTYLLYLALLKRLPYQASYTIAYATGIALAYALNRYLVFRQPGGRAGPLLVTLIYVGQYFLNLAIVSAAVHWFMAPAALAPLFAIAMTVPLTYLLNQRVFGGLEPDPEVLPAAAARPRAWGRSAAIVLLVGLPVLSLALNALAWLRFGLDLPYFDDWRAYDSGDIDSLEPTYLFQALNDTLTPMGLALDAIAQRLLDGNSIAYQFLSMVLVLGALMLLQWKLLRAALGDPLRAAACFVFALLMLQPGSYWGRENLAYQQALPLVFILAALWLGVARPWRDHWNFPAIFGLGLLAGFTYISGAFGALAAGTGFAVAAMLAPPHPGRVHFLRAGGALALAGAVTAGVQFVTAILPSQGGTHAPGVPMALPTQPDFWLYLLGKVGRSLVLPADRPILSLVLVLMALCGVVAATVLVARAVRMAAGDAGSLLPLAAVFGAVSAMVGTYLLLVAAGRTNFRPPEVQAALDVFVFGFQRFHFFWASLVWPWVVAAAFFFADRRAVSGGGLRPYRPALAVCVGVAVAVMIGRGALDHFGHQRFESRPRQATAECLQSELQAGGPIRCPEWKMQDLRNAYIYARHIGASFVQHFPIHPVVLGVEFPAPWFRLGRDGDSVQARNMVQGAPSMYRGDKDAQIYLEVGHVPEMARCTVLDVAGRLKSSQADTLTVYFREPGQLDFTQDMSGALTVGGATQAGVFHIRLD
ncbi:MAG: GtrA family protein, partial [Ramlibacter sp.]